MSSIIIEKLKEIESAAKDDPETISITSTGSISSDNKNSDSAVSEKRSESVAEPSYHQMSMQTTQASLKPGESVERYHIAKVWSEKLKKLSYEQRVYAEKAIYDVLFEAQLGKLRKSSVKINERKHSRRSPSATSLSQTTATSNNSTQPSESTIEHSHSAHCNVSSEIVLTESYPNEVGLVSSESHVEEGHKKSNPLLKLPPDGTRKQTFIVAATPSSVREGSPSSLHNASDNRNCPATVATNTPDCLISQLSRYLYRFI